jgi:hypothetical protein
VDGQHHAPAASPPGKTRYPLYRRLGGSQGRSGRVRKISPPPGFDLRTVQPVASRYTNWAIPAGFCQCHVSEDSVCMVRWHTCNGASQLNYHSGVERVHDQRDANCQFTCYLVTYIQYNGTGYYGIFQSQSIYMSSSFILKFTSFILILSSSPWSPITGEICHFSDCNFVRISYCSIACYASVAHVILLNQLTTRPFYIFLYSNQNQISSSCKVC